MHLKKKPEIDDEIKIEKEEYDSDEDFTETQRKNRTNSADDFDNDDSDPNRTLQNKRNMEHMNPKSYSWCLIRYAILKLTQSNMTSFLNVVGIEPQEIAIQSPLIHQLMKSIEKWAEMLYAEMNSRFSQGKRRT